MHYSIYKILKFSLLQLSLSLYDLFIREAFPNTSRILQHLKYEIFHESVFNAYLFYDLHACYRLVLHVLKILLLLLFISCNKYILL